MHLRSFVQWLFQPLIVMYVAQTSGTAFFFTDTTMMRGCDVKMHGCDATSQPVLETLLLG